MLGQSLSYCRLNEEVASEEELLKMIMTSTNDESQGTRTVCIKTNSIFHVYQDSRESIVGEYNFDYADKVSTIQAKVSGTT